MLSFLLAFIASRLISGMTNSKKSSVTIIEFIFPPNPLLPLIHFIYISMKRERENYKEKKIYGRKQALRIYVRV